MNSLRAITYSSFALLMVVVVSRMMRVDISIITIIIIVIGEEIMKSFERCNLFFVDRSKRLFGQLLVDAFPTEGIEFQRQQAIMIARELLNEGIYLYEEVDWISALNDYIYMGIIDILY